MDRMNIRMNKVNDSLQFGDECYYNCIRVLVSDVIFTVDDRKNAEIGLVP